MKFIATAVGVGALGVSLPLLAGGTAYATGCTSAQVEYSLDGGKTWTTADRMDRALVTKIQVRLKELPQDTCEYSVSLASYESEGSTWQSSGKQTFLGWDTTKLSKSSREATLDVSDHQPKCFGQLDLYRNGKKYDGGANPVPRYPDTVFGADLITAWNGGKKCETPTSPPTSVASTGTPTPSGKPPTSIPPPTGQETPQLPPTSNPPPPNLAETGSDSNTGVIVGASAGVLLLFGTGALLWGRRRNNNGVTPV